ncbi:T9SS type A sorting domain-containing protein [candidate division WOR-3 bacterium]|uniref:T9SS type A sorting domain-containing protein n=1 Tax=candidate division WOR-3 bacterium TaxID=2052148 RepID=A0A9D5K9T8_UNCW3|nr:T9SS type A sorting domain-containing protein [candidate division WOR-3 bacterium]MBD3365077.1 T9SS type A sorting domain-containing protein [candidate division WOR-3 bacterium]
MLKKLAILTLITASFGWAAFDVAVDDAITVPAPAVVDSSNEVVAFLSTTHTEAIEDVPIFGKIEELVTSAVLIEEDFETEGEFPPGNWTQVIFNTDTIGGELPCTWTQSDFDPEFHNGNYGAYVWGSDNASNEWLITPSMNLSATSEDAIVTLNFCSAFLPFEVNAHHYICVSLDGGETWIDTLADLSRDYLGPYPEERIRIDDEPNPINLDLSDYIGEEDVIIGFNYRKSIENLPSSWSLDDVTVDVKSYIERWASGEETVPVVAMTLPHIEHRFEESWVPEEEGSYFLTVWTELEGDEDPSNDEFVRIVKAGGQVDFAIGGIISPHEVETPNESIVPSCLVWNLTEDTCIAYVRCVIQGGGQTYSDNKEVMLEPANDENQGFPEPGEAQVSFKPFPVGEAGSEYTAVFTVNHPLDTAERNDSRSRDFVAGLPHAIVPVEVLEPVDGETYDAGETLTPTAIYENMGVEAESDWFAILEFSSNLGVEEYDTVHVIETMEPGEPCNVAFSDVTLADENAEYTVNFSCYMNIEDFQGGELEVGFSAQKGAIEDGPMPKEYALAVSNSLANSNMMVRYSVPKSGHVAIKLYDVTGKLVETFVEKPVTPGYGSVELNTEDIPSGLYFIRMNADQFSATRKFVLIR